MSSDSNPLQRYLSFDYGEKRLGVATGNSLLTTTQALDVLPVERDQPNWDSIKSIIDEWEIDACIIGLPLNMDGSEQLITKKAKKFANRLHGRFGLPCFLHDERLSSAEVKEYLFEMGGYKKLKDKAIDAYAAELILKGYFEQLSSD